MRSKQLIAIGTLLVLWMSLSSVATTSAATLGGGSGPSREPDEPPAPRVSDPAVLIAELQDDVADLDLKNNKKKKLTKTLDKALDKYEDGKICKTVKKLNKFIKKVDKYVRKGLLTVSEAEALISSAQIIITQLDTVDCKH